MKIDFSNLKFLPRRTESHSENNAGYILTIDHLPWGEARFSFKRYSITKTEN
jgi:hypothetical protein